jgi:hypothetical protein
LNDVDDDCSLHLSDEEVQIEQSKKGRGMSFHYEQVTETEDYHSAVQYMRDSMPDYTHRYFKDSESGRKEYFRCKGFLKCQKLVYIDLPVHISVPQST